MLTFLVALTGCQSPAQQTFVAGDEGDNIPTQQRNQAIANINVKLGLAYMQRHEMPKAKEKLLTALKADPNSPTTLDALGYYFEVTGNVPAASRYYKRAIGVAPHSGRALNNYGTFLCRQGDYSKAETYLLKAANLENYADTAAAYENAGFCALGIPNATKAIGYFKLAVKQDPMRVNSYYELAKLYYQQRNAALAQNYFLSYAQLTKLNAASLWLGIRIANALGDTKQVMKYGLALKQHYPQSPQAKFYGALQRT